MITKATKPLEAEIKELITKLKIKELITKLNELIEGQNFISDKHDKMAKDYKSILIKSRKQKKEINKLNKRTDELQKKSDSKEFKLDELKQYNRRQNLELMGIPFTENEDVTQITLHLIEKLNVEITEEDISIAYRLPLKRRNSNLKNRRHPPIIVRFLSRHKRNEIFAKRFNAKLISNFPVNQMNHLFISENLT